MKIATNIVGGLLGFIFVAISLMVLLGLAPKPENPPPLVAQFMGVFVASNWLIVVKVCELIGGILVAIPKTRNFGLLVLGPIVINIVCFHVLVAKGGLVGPPLLVAVLAAFLLWAERRSFLGLLH